MKQSSPIEYSRSKIVQKGTSSECMFSTVLLHMHWQFLLGTSAMAMSLQCNHWQFLLGTSSMAKENFKKWQDPTLCQYSPLGVCNVVLLLLLLVFWYLGILFYGFLFSGSLFCFWRAGKTTEKWRTSTLCRFSHFRGCKHAFGYFIVCFGPLVPFENHVKTMAKYRYHWRKPGGLGT